mgnify:FL=1
MKTILDSSFIISCINKKIDFLTELGELGLGEIVVPEEVLRELERVSKNKKAKIKDREAAKLGLKLLARIRKIRLGKKYVDLGLLNYVRENEDYVATIDKKLKEKLRKIVIIRGERLGLS